MLVWDSFGRVFRAATFFFSNARVFDTKVKVVEVLV